MGINLEEQLTAYKEKHLVKLFKIVARKKLKCYSNKKRNLHMQAVLTSTLLNVENELYKKYLKIQRRKRKLKPLKHTSVADKENSERKRKRTTAAELDVDGKSKDSNERCEDSNKTQCSEKL